MYIPPELIVFFTAMLPTIELKLAVPLGIEMGLSPISTLFFGISGSILPAVLILTFLEPLTKWAGKHSPLVKKSLKKLFKKTRKEHSKKFKRYGAVLLIALIAIPLPGSGAGTAAIISVLFGVDYWRAFTLIIIGTIASALLLLGGFSSIFAIIHHFS